METVRSVETGRAVEGVSKEAIDEAENTGEAVVVIEAIVQLVVDEPVVGVVIEAEVEVMFVAKAEVVIEAGVDAVCDSHFPPNRSV